MAFCIDVSNYQGLLTPQRVACLKDSGVEHVIVRAGLEHGPQTMPNWDITIQQVDALTAGGIDWSVYLWCYMGPQGWNPRDTVRQTRDLLGGRPCQWFHLDAEDTGYVGTPQANEAWLLEALDEGHRLGLKMSIYTGKWWWDAYMRGVTVFGAELHVPLWTAQYDNVPDLTFAPYGGWTAPAFGKQWRGSGMAGAALCGITPDWNTFDETIMTPVEPPAPPEPMTTVSIAEMRTWVNDSLAHAEEVHAQRTARLDRAEQGEVWIPA